MTTRTSYQYKPPSLPRPGSYERTVCYTLPTSNRNFDFQNPNKRVECITGREIRHYSQTPSKDIKLFSQRTVYPQPDSKRTLVPDLAPQPSNRAQRCKSSTGQKFNSNSSEFNLISKINNELPNRRPCNPKVYQSFELTDHAKPEPYHRLIKPALFKKYDNTSQIKYLPGCIKRDQTEINDNYNPNKNPALKQTESFNTKVSRDYRSNVACLPGSVINDEKNRNYLYQPNQKKYESQDIFNINYTNTDGQPSNTFNVSHKKRIEQNDTKYNNSNPTINRTLSGIRRNEYKNRSQFKII